MLARTPRFIAPEGCGALSSPPKDAELANSRFFGPGRPEWPFPPGPLIVLCNEWGVGRESVVLLFVEGTLLPGG